jgi:ATP-dependent protease HslVU (ClpYQ) peptidase subunit
MSLILAIKKGEAVYLATDSRISNSDHIHSTDSEGDFKIQRLGSCYVGAAGTVASIQLMMGHPEWFELNGKPLTKKYLVQNVVPKYYDALDKVGLLDREESNEHSPKSKSYFIVTDGVGIFKIDSDFEVMSFSRCVAVGCTEELADAVFIHLGEDFEPNELMLDILRSSAKRNNGVGAPYHLVNTRDNRFETVEA